jgi:hypothetical protein
VVWPLAVMVDSDMAAPYEWANSKAPYR